LEIQGFKRIFAACGFTYDVLKSNTVDPVKNIASVNIPCGFVEVDGGTYFGQFSPVWKALKNAKIGKIALDTLYDSIMLEPWLTKKRTSPQFLGFDYLSASYKYKVTTRMPLRHDSTSPVKNDTTESYSRFFAAVMEKSGVRYDDIMKFRICEDTSRYKEDGFQICNVGDIKMVRSIATAGFPVDTLRMGLILRWFSK
jgi:hypothetical protein